ncbi:hypothetical protein [Calothrix sp. NIES-3974]|uniref:hypothetical protein n=1 Tax=Calothrix sp. NIES-3974 TaxID=2005462 RepID=UPI000B5F4D85|nr:hypothetical protein [Calothrix sp. NIES-3974]BAZ06303.1 hypothetical protein NIES3974_29610 [Calothrix sp. NIES-3974]
MTHQELFSEFLSLPAEAQSQVARLITFFKQKYTYGEPLSSGLNTDLVNNEFIGMWRDRQDLDSTIWVRNIRESEWSKSHD